MIVIMKCSTKDVDININHYMRFVMCVLVVSEELKKQLNSKNSYSTEFDDYWQQQAKDELNLVELEKTTDTSFLEMVKSKPLA